MSLPVLQRTGTPLDEYLVLEATSVGQKPKMEYDGNDIVMMSGVTERHFLIASNLLQHLGPQFRKRGCRAGNADLRVNVGRSYRYPDLVAYCPPGDFSDEKPPALRNPILLVEVLSDTTAQTDLEAKLREYTSIPSLLEYWIVAQDAPALHRYARAADGWIVHLYEGLEVAFTSEPLGIAADLATIFEDVDFRATAPDPTV